MYERTIIICEKMLNPKQINFVPHFGYKYWNIYFSGD